MRRLNLILILIALLAMVHCAVAGSYALTDGSTLSGEPISFNEGGLVVKSDAGEIQPRVPWSKFTQDSLKQLFAEAKSPRDKSYIEPLLEEVVQEKAKRKEIVVKPVEHPARPVRHTGIFAAFSSPIGLAIFFILYLANLFAAFEVAVYRYQSPGMVCGISAAAPFIGPIIFLCLKPQYVPQETIAAHQATETDMTVSTGVPGSASAALASEDSNPLAPPPGVAHSSLHMEGEAAAEAPPRPVLPEPIVFRRGEFSFNRRFFETKLAAFMRVVPGEAEKELVVYVRSARGEFVGRRVTQITQNDLTLQVFKENATADETIPFLEMQEVQIRHQDSF